MIKNKQANVCKSSEKDCNNQSLPKNRGGKFFRKTAICALAGFMGAMGLLGAGCTPSSANTNAGLNSPAAELGLITPRADDPTILTTESGLEIKYGNVSISPSLGSGALSGFPYFTTNDGSKDYIWVIIGGSQDVDYSPAGNAIDSDINAILQKVAYDFGLLPPNQDIPYGHVLVCANKVVDSIYYNDTHKINNIFDCLYSGTTIHTTLEGYYSSGSFGLSSVKALISSVTLKTQGVYWDGVSAHITAIDTTENCRLFPLSGCAEGSFYYGDYFNAAQMGNQEYWLRGGPNRNCSYYNISYYAYRWAGASLIQTATNYSIYGVRPAFCMSL